MTTVTNIATMKVPTLDDVMASGICAHCRKPIVGHIKDATWMGCEHAATTELPAGPEHPLRRQTDVITMVPVAILQTVAAEHDVLLKPGEQPERRRRHNSFREAAAHAVHTRGTEVRRTRRTKMVVGPGRGKQPGRYLATGKEPSKMTQRINTVYFALKNNKRGVSAKKLSTRLKVPTGTVAWALTQLQKQGVIKHIPPGKHAAGVMAAAS